MDWIGPAAGLGASVGWLLTSLFFTAAGRRLGPTAVNALRLVLAVILLGSAHAIMFGSVWPAALAPRELFMLALSGFIGLAIGDQLLYTAFVDIGPRLTLLLMTTTPIFAAVFGVLALGAAEVPGVLEVVGMSVTIAGVAWVVAERPHTEEDDRPHPHRVRGIVFATLAAACQAGGAMFSKLGMGHGSAEAADVDPLAATYVRMVFATVVFVPIVLAMGARRSAKIRAGAALKPTNRTGSRGAGYWFTLLGAIAGPFFGVWMSLIAYDRAPLGVAQTLCGLAPVLILPFSAWLYRERVTWRASLGAIVAVGGATVLAFAEPASDSQRALREEAVSGAGAAAEPDASSSPSSRENVGTSTG